MDVVIVVGPYFPYSTAVGICISKIAELLGENNKVTVISLKNNIENEDFDSYKNHQIIRVGTKNMIWRNKIDYKLKGSKGLKRLFAYAELRIQQAVNLTRIFKNKYGLDNKLVIEYTKVLKSYTKNIDLLIPCCIPFEAVYSAMFYKKYVNKKVRLIPFLFDSYSQNTVMFRFNLNRITKEKIAIKLEKELIQLSERVFYTDNWKEHILSISDDSKKVKYIEHPLVAKINGNRMDLTDKKGINLVYQGECNISMRPPDKVLDFFKAMNKYYQDFKLHFWGFGNAYNIVEMFEIKNKEFIHSYGRASKEIADNYMLDADILIIIGNLDSKVLPSKVYECISSGKPIIYFYHSENDAPIRLLNKYPFKKLIKQGDNNLSTIKETISWMKEVKGKMIEFEEIEKFFLDATPKYILNFI